MGTDQLGQEEGKDYAILPEHMSTKSLPFNSDKQEAMVGYFLDDDTFFRQAKDKIRAEWLENPLNSQIWKAKVDFFAQYGRPPCNMDEIKATTAFTTMDSAVRVRLGGQIIRAQVAKTNFGLDVIRDEMTFWIKTQLFTAYVEKSMTLYNQSEIHAGAIGFTKFDDAFQTLAKGVLEIRGANFDPEPTFQFDDIATGLFFRQQEEELKNACTFGLPLIDKLINKNCVDSSSLLRGDHTILLAPTNGGKSSAMINVAVANVLKQKLVLFITHEGRPADIASKMVSCITGMNGGQLIGAIEDQAKATKVKRFAKVLGTFLTYLPLNKPGLTVEEVEVAIRREQEKCILKHGRGFDIIIDDYPAKLLTVLASKGNMQRRSMDEYIYNFFTQIGLQLNCHVLTAIQTNREGNKINSGAKNSEDRLLTMNDVMESYGVMTTATTVITLNRDPDAQAAGRMTFHIAKSRSNETGWSIVSKTSFDKCLTHGQGMPATYYRGNSTMQANIANLIDQFNGVSIPDHYYYA